MRETAKHVAYERAFSELLPLLEGRVFHVTKEGNWARIVETGKLLAAPADGEYIRSFGSQSYFRERGCVCFFDYRDHTSEEFQKHYKKCVPTLALSEESPIRIMFLSQTRYALLVPWSEWKTDEARGKNVVPYVEAGIEGSVPLEWFDEVMTVTTTEDRNSLEYRLKFARRRPLPD